MLIPLHLGYFIPLRNWSRERVIKMAKFQSGQIYPVPVSAHDRWSRLLKLKEESSEEEEFALNFARGGTGTRNQEQLVAPAWPVLFLSLSPSLRTSTAGWYTGRRYEMQAYVIVWEWRLLSDPQERLGCGRFAFSIAATKLLRTPRWNQFGVHVACVPCLSKVRMYRRSLDHWIVEKLIRGLLLISIIIRREYKIRFNKLISGMICLSFHRIKVV